jgi:alpha-beta hydrolase superfamily lysophospholipase
MNVISKIACLVLIMNTLHGFGQEGVRYQTVQVDGLNIFYREAGPANGPVLLLLHGVPTSSRMYQPMLESALSSKYRLIAPDFPGFGHSSWPSPKEFSYTFDHLARVTEGFTDALKLGHYTLFLHDYGGPVGMRMAVDHPEKVETIAQPTRPRFGKVFSPSKRHATGTWAPLRIRNESTPTPGPMSSIS